MSIKNLKIGYALAPKRLVDRKMKVRFMYRENPDDECDSGWRFFSGYETDEYVNNPDNIGLYDVSTIAEIDSDIIPYLEYPIGCAYEREDENGEFSESVDFWKR